MTKPSRVFILAREPLFAQGVRSLLQEQAGIEVVGTATVGPEAMAQLRVVAPDVVVVEAKGEEQGALVAEILETFPTVKVVGLTPEDNRLHIYYAQMRYSRQVEDFLEAIREPIEAAEVGPGVMRVLVVYQGAYSRCILQNLRSFQPADWSIEVWTVPADLPGLEVADARTAAYWDEVLHGAAVLPAHLPPTDLVLSLLENPVAAQLLPSIAERAGAKAVLAPVEDPAWLPEGVVRLLRARLNEIGVAAAFPKPFCSLAEGRYGVAGQETVYESPWIETFARHFGQPAFRIVCDGEDVMAVEVERDTPCGCARALAQRLTGMPVRDVMSYTAAFCAEYGCLATRRVQPRLGKSLFQAACELMQQAVAAGIGVDLRYVR